MNNINNNNLISVSPVKVYGDAELFKEVILKDNLGQSGIYRWVNNVNNKTFVGSGKDLKIRLACYYKLDMLKREKRPIHRALLKYGHENFTLEIIECCPISELLVREQYYLDLLKPDYNVLEFAYSSLGYRHSAETIALLKKKITPPPTPAPACARGGVFIFIFSYSLTI